MYRVGLIVTCAAALLLVPAAIASATVVDGADYYGIDRDDVLIGDGFISIPYYSMPAGPVVETGGAIPEPGTMALLALGAVALLRRRPKS